MGCCIPCIKETYFKTFYDGVIEEKLGSKTVYFIRYSLFRILLFSLYKFGWAFLIGFISAIMFPEDVIFFVGDREKPKVLGILLGIAAGLTLFVGPISGNLSDLTRLYKCFFCLEIGKRKPYIYIPHLLYMFTVVARTYVRQKGTVFLVVYSILGIFGIACMCIASTAYTALFPDLFHPSQFDLVSGVLGFFNLLGGAVSVGVYGYLWNSISYQACVFSAAFIGLLSLFPIALFNEEQALNLRILRQKHDRLKKEQKKLKEEEEEEEEEGNDNNNTKIRNEEEIDRSFVSSPQKVCGSCLKCWRVMWNQTILYITPFFHWNFFWVFIARFIFMFSIAALQSYLLYFLRDCLESYTLFGISNIANNESEAQSVIGVVVFFFGLISSFLGPLATRCVHRKYVVAISGFIMVIGCAGYIIFRSYLSVIVLFSIPLGMGMGSFYAVDMALQNEVLPNPDEQAKDLAIFGIATNIPFAFAAPVIGLMISIGNNDLSDILGIRYFGYYIMFGFSMFVQIAGSVFVLLVRAGQKKKRMKDKHELDDEKVPILLFSSTNEDEKLDEEGAYERIENLTDDSRVLGVDDRSLNSINGEDLRDLNDEVQNIFVDVSISPITTTSQLGEKENENLGLVVNENV